jgi:uncharacterized protein (DUF58 family)
MSTTSELTGRGALRALWFFARYRLAHIDRPGWRRFFLALVGLGLAFLLALYSTALRESGRVELAAVVAVLSLVLTGAVAFKVVPYLARRTALERWMIGIEYEFTREGAVYLSIIFVIAIAALNTGNNLLFIILASLLAGILVSGVLSQIALSQLELDFVLPEHLFAEQPVISRLTVRNLKWFLPSFSVTISAHAPGRRKRRKGSTPPPRPILNSPVYVPYIPHRSSVTQHVELIFPRRGRYTQEGFRVSSKFPFGFLRKSHRLPSHEEILVLPNVQPTEEFYEILPLIGGEMDSFCKGRGHDLYAIRDYQASDTTRYVDWKATAKAQQLKVREFTREDERRLVLVLDARLTRADEKMISQFEKAVTFCACLAWHFYEIDAQMQFLTQGFQTPMAASGEIIYHILETLALIEPKLVSSISPEELQARLASAAHGFNIILTSLPRGSIPTHIWTSSYLIFLDSP